MKKLSKRDRILVIVCSLIIVVITSYYGWFFWPWVGGRVVRIHDHWDNYQKYSISSDEIPYITNHSPYSKRQVIRYFHDIALRMEYEPLVKTIRKWESPLCVYVIGNPTPEDRSVLTDVFLFLNSIPGFPGITEVSSLDESNIQLHFKEDHMGETATGYFYILAYDEKGNISRADIRIKNSLPQSKKASVLWEELLQVTGPMNDTALTADTLFYAGREDIPRASQLDQTIIEMIYHPLIKSGMEYIHCLSTFMIYLR